MWLHLLWVQSQSQCHSIWHCIPVSVVWVLLQTSCLQGISVASDMSLRSSTPAVLTCWKCKHFSKITSHVGMILIVYKSHILMPSLSHSRYPTTPLSSVFESFPTVTTPGLPQTNKILVHFGFIQNICISCVANFWLPQSWLHHPFEWHME
jgi:hypothetical protein